jgi:GDP-L-fucose synthase
MEHYSNAMHVNIGTGEDVTIGTLAAMIARTVGWHGRFVFDISKPDGTPRKLLDVSRIRQMGWQHKIPLERGISQTYAWFVENLKRLRSAA